MNNEQKQRMLRLRGEGKTYAAIAGIMDISTSAVKSFFSREGGKAEQSVSDDMPDETSMPGFCRQCGADLHIRVGNRMKRFCSERCRQKWWRAHPGTISDKASVSVCVGCGKPFKNRGNPGRRYCSRACYYAHRFGGRAVNE